MADTVSHTPSDVMEGIDNARSVGLGVKVNTVVQKGVNEDQLVTIAEACTKRGITLRFIEYMDVGNTNAWQLDDVITGQDIRHRLKGRFGSLSPVAPKHRGQVARTYGALTGRVWLHRIGVQPVLWWCSRVRLSANGSLYTCLFSSKGHDLKGILRMNGDVAGVQRREASGGAQRSVFGGTTTMDVAPGRDVLLSG